MLIRISLIIAILAAIAVGVLNFVQVKEKITTLITQRDTEKGLKVDALGKLATAEKELDTTKKNLASTKQALTDMTGERDKAVAEADTLTKKAGELTDKLAKTTEERDTARQKLASYEGTGYTPEQIVKFGTQIKETQLALDVAIEEKKILARELNKKIAELEHILQPEKHVLLPPNLKGEIAVTDPKWEFVVLDIGEDHGVLEHGELLVSRGGKLVGKIVVRSVQKDRSIANVMPGWKLTDMMEHDQVIAAYPSPQ